MSWASVTLGEVSTNIQTGPFGSQLHQSDYSDGGVPVVMPKDLVDGHISEDSIARASMSHVDRLSRHKIEVGDILYSRRGDVGRCAFATEVEQGWLCGTGCLRVTIDQSKAIPKFIFYQLQKAETIGWVEKHAVGSTMLNLNTSILGSVPIELPSMAEQQMIVHVLSAYDDLIENNQKQIKLLEEAAQRLYKEWFVDLRFPGHENVKITDGVPEGWHVVKLSDVADVNKTSISKQYPYDYVDYVDLGSVSKGRIETITRFSIQETPGRAKRVASDGDIIWGMVRPNLKSYALVFHPAATSVFSTGFAVLSAQKVPFSFLYCYVTQDDFVGYLVNCTNGAAYPAVKPIHFEKAPIMVPTDDLLKQFNLIAKPMYRKIEILEKQIQQAKESRDRLLPKLMSGELEV